jgi:hypothetical protein
MENEMEYGIAKSAQMPVGITKAAERDSDVLRELEVMEKEIARLGDTFGHLAQRIDPICRPSSPTPEPGNSAPDRITSALAGRIRVLRMHIGRIGDAVAGTHDRLDL